MKFYCIIRSRDRLTNPDVYRLLSGAADERGIEFVTLEADTFDYLRGFDDIDPGAAMYREGLGEKCRMLEFMFALRGVSGLYSDSHVLQERRFAWGSVLRMQNVGVSIVPTVFGIGPASAEMLPAYVDALGGFPVILKTAGGSHGTGVRKYESIEELATATSSIPPRSSNFALRKFIADARHFRVVVLGDKALDASEYLLPDDDFRTNVADYPTVIPYDIADGAVKKLAVDALKAVSVEFGGVDILQAADGTLYVAEVNFPCNFARNQLLTGTDIAGSIVDYLVEKRMRGIVS